MTDQDGKKREAHESVSPGEVPAAIGAQEYLYLDIILSDNKDDAEVSKRHYTHPDMKNLWC